MAIVKNPFHLIGKMLDYSWQGLLVHISALLGGSVIWKKELHNHEETTEQWGFLDFTLLTGPLRLLILTIHKNQKLILFFHTLGLPILFALNVVLIGLSFIKDLMTSTLTYSLSWPAGIGAWFIHLNSKKSYSAMNGEVIHLDNSSTLIHPHIPKRFQNPLAVIIDLNVKGFRSAGLLSAPLLKRLSQSYFFLSRIFMVPHTLALKIIDLIDSHPLTQLISFILFPIRLALTLLASTLKAINAIAHISFELLAMPIVLIVHAISLPFYKTLKTELNTLEVHTANQYDELWENAAEDAKSNTTTFEQLASALEKPSFKAALDTRLIGDLKLVKDPEHQDQYSLVGKTEDNNYRIALTQENSPIVLKALHHNAFKWASDLHHANQLDEVIEVLNDLGAAAA